jgi:hypothetical protein
MGSSGTLSKVSIPISSYSPESKIYASMTRMLIMKKIRQQRVMPQTHQLKRLRQKMLIRIKQRRNWGRLKSFSLQGPSRLKISWKTRILTIVLSMMLINLASSNWKRLTKS